jgi:hypothetical protein
MYLYFGLNLVDKNTVRDCWLASPLTAKQPPPSVNQDIWHALHRIDQVMNHKHPGMLQNQSVHTH